MAEDDSATPETATDGEEWEPPRGELPADRSLKPWRPGKPWAARRRIALGLLLAIVLPPLAWAGWMQFGPRLIVAQMMRKYARARTLQLTASLRDDLGPDPEENGPVVLRRVEQFALGYAPPDRYYCREGEGVRSLCTVLDGHSAFVEVGRLGAVYSCPAPRALPRAWPPLVGPPAAGAGGVGDPLALATGTARLADVTKLQFGMDPRWGWLRRLAGPPGAWVISMQQTGRDDVAVVWVDRRTHLLRQAALESATVGRVITYHTMVLDGELPAGSLRYRPPTGVRPVTVADLESASSALVLRLAAQRPPAP